MYKKQRCHYGPVLFTCVLSNLLYQLKCQLILQWHYIEYLFIKLAWNPKTAHIKSGKSVVLIYEQLIFHLLEECNIFCLQPKATFIWKLSHITSLHAFIPRPVGLFMEYLSQNLGKNLRNTLVISRKFKHSQSHRTIIWGRNALKQNVILIESFQVMKNLPYPMILISIRWPMSCYSK